MDVICAYPPLVLSRDGCEYVTLVRVLLFFDLSRNTTLFIGGTKSFSHSVIKEPWLSHELCGFPIWGENNGKASMVVRGCYSLGVALALVLNLPLRSGLQPVLHEPSSEHPTECHLYFLTNSS